MAFYKPNPSYPLYLYPYSVHYAFGNIDFDEKRWASAKRAYEASLKIGLVIAPIHPITAAAYCSLGCIEYERNNLENAK
jgi:hypothetical protein